MSLIHRPSHRPSTDFSFAALPDARRQSRLKLEHPPIPTTSNNPTKPATAAPLKFPPLVSIATPPASHPPRRNATQFNHENLTFHVSCFTFHVSRSTFHAPRFTIQRFNDSTIQRFRLEFSIPEFMMSAMAHETITE